MNINEQINMINRSLAPIIDASQRMTAVYNSVSRSVQEAVANYNAQMSGILSSFDRIYCFDVLSDFARHALRQQQQLTAGIKRWFDAHAIVTTELPKRGWYLYGNIPARLSVKLADMIKSGEWTAVDALMMALAGNLDLEGLRGRVQNQGVPACCVARLDIFLSEHKAAHHEQAVFVGIPLLDEIAGHFYNGRAFTTKRSRRNDQSKPEIAFKIGKGSELDDYYLDFVQAYGALHEDCDALRLADESYWNRHAIVHGKMKRAMGSKDSAKCLMAVAFLVYGLKVEDVAPESESDESNSEPTDTK